MGVETEEEEEGEVMSVPERFETLRANFLMSGRVPASVVSAARVDVEGMANMRSMMRSMT